MAKAFVKLLLFTSILLGSLVLPARAGAQHFPPDDALRLMLRYIVEDTGTPGVVVGVLEPDGTQRVVSYGSAGPDAAPLGPRSGFQVASITKPLTGAVLAAMVAAGEVQLDDPVSMFLPDHVPVPSRGGRAITLGDLATHTSALPNWPRGLQLTGHDPLVGYTTDDLYAFLSSHELRGVPGTGYRYSNLGYGILGHALGRAAGMSYRDLLRERLFLPLGMNASDVAVAGELPDRMARGHRRGEPVPFYSATEALQAAGAVISTAEDLLAFLAASVGPPRSELERALRVSQDVRVPDGDRGAGWGFSWRTGLFPDGTRIRGHGGEAGGFKSRIAFDPDRRMGIVVLANDVHFDEDLETMLIYLDPPPAEWAEVPVGGEVLVRYAGAYSDDGGAGQSFVRLEDEGYLTWQPVGSPRMRLYATSDSTFHSLRRPLSFTFRPDAGGAGVALVIADDARSRSAERTARTVRKTADEASSPRVVAGWEPAPAGGGGRTNRLWLVIAAVLASAALFGAFRARSARAGGWTS
jgi:serine-type D-Ala-D-Ala carboxypeptidase/endopeptidase